MSEPTRQNFANHTRLDPQFHFVLLPGALLALGLAVWNIVRAPGLSAAWILLATLLGIVAVFRLRIYPLKVQDRVIRLEERLRLAMVLDVSLRSRIPELTVGQLAALRFAPDEEIPELVRRALSEKLDAAGIKKSIKDWRADHHRV